MSTLAALLPHTDLTGMPAPSAPGLCFAFGTWRGAEGWPEPISRYAAGKGATPELAALSCLGEMAENLSLGVAAHAQEALAFQHLTGAAFSFDPRDALVRDLNDPHDPGSEGCASAETIEAAIEAAMCERFERAAIHEWWIGREKARAAPEEWVREPGLRAYEQELRGGNPERRLPVQYFSIGERLPLSTVIAVAQGEDGTESALGYACAGDFGVAAKKALEEAILQEVPILTGRGKALHDLSAEERRARRRSQHLGAERDRYFGEAGSEGKEAREDGEPRPVIALGAVSLGVNGLCVARVIAPGLPVVRPLCFGDDPAPL